MLGYRDQRDQAAVQRQLTDVVAGTLTRRESSVREPDLSDARRLRPERMSPTRARTSRLWRETIRALPDHLRRDAGQAFLNCWFALLDADEERPSLDAAQ
jgi:cyclopropane fatty-acyl-phospholipid synthase-like methyltransferase